MAKKYALMGVEEISDDVSYGLDESVRVWFVDAFDNQAEAEEARLKAEAALAEVKASQPASTPEDACPLSEYSFDVRFEVWENGKTEPHFEGHYFYIE